MPLLLDPQRRMGLGQIAPAAKEGQVRGGELIQGLDESLGTIVAGVVVRERDRVEPPLEHRERRRDRRGKSISCFRGLCRCAQPDIRGWRSKSRHRAARRRTRPAGRPRPRSSCPARRRASHRRRRRDPAPRRASRAAAPTASAVFSSRALPDEFAPVFELTVAQRLINRLHAGEAASPWNGAGCGDTPRRGWEPALHRDRHRCRA